MDVNVASEEVETARKVKYIAELLERNDPRAYGVIEQFVEYSEPRREACLKDEGLESERLAGLVIDRMRSHLSAAISANEWVRI